MQRPPCGESLEHAMPHQNAVDVPLTTMYRRDHGRRSKEEKTQDQQYLTPSEEKALEKYSLPKCFPPQNRGESALGFGLAGWQPHLVTWMYRKLSSSCHEQLSGD